MKNSNNFITIAAVVAMAENRVIGNKNQLPWRLPADLKHFKTITMGHPIIMGRKTYASIGKALPGRTNIVITRDAQFAAPGCKVATSIDEAIQYAEQEKTQIIYIIGGAEIYNQSFAKLARIYLTIVHHEFAGDVYFPELKPDEWQVVEREDFAADELNPYPYSFLTLDRLAKQ